jgi:predicted nucleotidyltransferase
MHRPRLGPVQLASKLVEEIRAVASESPSVERVWLFGSRARDEATPRADIDLAVECPAAGAADFARVSLRMSELETLLPVDVVRLEEAGAEMSRRVLRDGVLLYER